MVWDVDSVLPANLSPAPHLAAIDAEAWPGVAAVPAGWAARLRAGRAERAFARACAKAGVCLDPEQGADLVVEEEALFARIGESGWVGLAEGFMAGEWSTEGTDQLVDVLSALISAGYRPRARTRPGVRDSAGGEVPPDLVAHFAGDGLSAFQGHFSTGVPTTERIAVKSWVRDRGASRTHFVDVTTISAPLDSGREDLRDAQQRSAEMLLDACGVGAGTHLAEWAASSASVAIAAAARRATVDCFVSDPDLERAIAERALFAGAGDAIRAEVADGAPRRGNYDAVVGVEKLEALAPRQKAAYLKRLGAMIQPGGRVALQTIARTEGYSPAADAAAESLRAYIWPGLSFSTPVEIAKLVDRSTGLRIVAQTHAPQHLEAPLRLQRHTFDAHLREAAADGFDVVYRRLWQWQFALREALARLGMLDLTQFTFVPRSRQGRR